MLSSGKWLGGGAIDGDAVFLGVGVYVVPMVNSCARVWPTCLSSSGGPRLELDAGDMSSDVAR